MTAVRPTASQIALPLRLLVFAFLFLAASDPFRFLHHLSDGTTDEGLKTMVWAALYLPFAALAGLTFRYIAWPWGQNRWLLAVYILVLLSVLWGPSLGGGLLAVAAPLGAALAVSYLAVSHSPEQMLRASAQALFACAIASILAVILVPDYGLMQGRHEGLWRGITGQKNNLAQIMALGALLSYLASRTAQGRARLLYLASAAVCLVVQFLAGSATAWLVGFIGLLSLIFFLTLQQSKKQSRLLLLLLCGLCSLGLVPLLAGYSETLFELIGRDATLTDRIPLWQGVWSAITDRPWLGFGYGQFWDESSGTAISYVRAFLLWDSPHAHNGWLELAINLGFVGVILFAISFLITCKRTARALTVSSSEFGLFAALVLVLTLAFNLTEAALVTGANILWVLYLYCALRLPLETRLRNAT
jgi:exopolysaccharide production protein ExoQ